MKLVQRVKEGFRSFLADLRAESVAEVDFKPMDCCHPPEKPNRKMRRGDARHLQGGRAPAQRSQG